VGSLESRVLVSARKLAELGVSADVLDEPAQLEVTPRQLQAPEFEAAAELAPELDVAADSAPEFDAATESAPEFDAATESAPEPDAAVGLALDLDAAVGLAPAPGGPGEADDAVGRGGPAPRIGSPWSVAELDG
jgi:hypothetical protein